jgi:hypothetical protein
MTVAAVQPVTSPFTGRRDALWGDARPGDTIPLPGGSIVRDVNANELVDGADTVVHGRGLPSPARRVDVRV